MNTHDLTCREFIDFLDDYFAEVQPASVRAVFDTHLACCRACVAYLQTYRETVAAARALGEADAKSGGLALDPADQAPPASPPEELILAILAALRESRSLS